MGKGWDNIGPGRAFQAWCEQWASGCLRALKPGAHLVAFGSPRTYHRLAAGIEDAGFEIRDEIATLLWVHGGGMPKGLNVGAASGDAAWEGWNTQLRPAHEPIVVARKPLAGATVANVRAYGTGAINVDACRVPTADSTSRPRGTFPHSDDAWGNGRPGEVSETHALGRWPANLLLVHAPLLGADGEVIGDACVDGCVPGCPVAELDRQSGVSVSRVGRPRSAAAGDGWGMTHTGAEYDDAGGASRFFPVFRYEAKAPASQRPKLADGTAHNTVKPLDLMRWLVRLVTPPGGTILDPFAGSGTTLEAALIEGFNAIGVEREREYADLCVERLDKPLQPSLFGGAA